MKAVLAGASDWHFECANAVDGLRMLPDRCVQCCVTSPPYFGLRNYQTNGQLGLEATPHEYVANMVAVFQEVYRVLRDDGTLWLNIGDSYASMKGASGGIDPKNVARRFGCRPQDKLIDGLKKKDLIGIPWMLAFALRADGWYLRSEIIWHKRSPMPESVTDRPTKAHEQVFLLTKSPKYYYDNVASAEKAIHGGKKLAVQSNGGFTSQAIGLGVVPTGNAVAGSAMEVAPTRNMRGVWSLSNEPFKGAHFAVMPTKLVNRCLVAGTSAVGACGYCRAPYKRLTKKRRVATRPGTDTKTLNVVHPDSPLQGHAGTICGNRDPQRHVTTTETTGWQAGCACGGPIVKCLTLDPFSGAGTVALVSQRLGLRSIGIDLNPDYVQIAKDRLNADALTPRRKAA